MVLQILLEARHLSLFDLDCSIVFFNSVARKNRDVNNCATHTGRDAQRGILNIRCLLTKYGTQQLFFWCQLSFAFWGYLSDQDVSRCHFRSNVDDSRLIKAGQGRFTDIRNVRSDIFLTKLGVPCNTGQLFNVNSREAVFIHDTL